MSKTESVTSIASDYITGGTSKYAYYYGYEYNDMMKVETDGWGFLVSDCNDKIIFHLKCDDLGQDRFDVVENYLIGMMRFIDFLSEGLS